MLALFVVLLTSTLAKELPVGGAVEDEIWKQLEAVKQQAKQDREQLEAKITAEIQKLAGAMEGIPTKLEKSIEDATGSTTTSLQSKMDTKFAQIDQTLGACATQTKVDDLEKALTDQKEAMADQKKTLSEETGSVKSELSAEIEQKVKKAVQKLKSHKQDTKQRAAAVDQSLNSLATAVKGLQDRNDKQDQAFNQLQSITSPKVEVVAPVDTASIT